MPTPSTVGELRELLEDIPEEMPIRGQFQGEEHWDWTFLVEPQGEGPPEQVDQDMFVVSMDL